MTLKKVAVIVSSLITFTLILTGCAEPAETNENFQVVNGTEVAKLSKSGDDLTIIQFEFVDSDGITQKCFATRGNHQGGLSCNPISDFDSTDSLKPLTEAEKEKLAELLERQDVQ